jgi:hypothetical protein
MRFIHTPALSLALAAFVFGGCASAPPKQGSMAEKGCFNTREINAITALDDQHIFVKLSAARFHLFTVDQPCNGLRVARTINIADAARRVCGDGSTLISFDYPAVGPTRCRVRRIEPVANKGEALELIETRAAAEE